MTLLLPADRLLPVHPHKLLQQLLFGLHVGGIPDDAVYESQTLMLLPVHPHKLLQQLLLGLHVGGIPDDAIDGADADATAGAS
ncbi:hypothetical protein ACFU5E_16910 [Aeromonas bestiarum]|uniref:hypothetical protein n=1 Tax=Aeromonas bestiarum TaxID=105751 RepID=UPI00366BC6CF